MQYYDRGMEAYVCKLIKLKLGSNNLAMRVLDITNYTVHTSEV